MDSKKHAFPLSLLSSESNWAMMKLMECRLGIPADMPDIRNCQIQSVRVVELTDLQGQPINYSGTGGIFGILRVCVYMNVWYRSTL